MALIWIGDSNEWPLNPFRQKNRNKSFLLYDNQETRKN